MFDTWADTLTPQKRRKALKYKGYLGDNLADSLADTMQKARKPLKTLGFSRFTGSK